MVPIPAAQRIMNSLSVMEQPTALIVSDDPEFSRAITSRWQLERSVPLFTLMSSDIQLGFDPETLQLAIAGRVRAQALSPVLEALATFGKRVVFVSEDTSTLQTVRDRWPGMIALRQQENWLDTLILVGSEALYRMQAEARALHAEKAHSLLEHEATLGRYILEMRHTLNNMLTATLGNSELLLLEPGSLSAPARAQIETIRNMALRIHEILRRFSSLEKELSVETWQSGKQDRAVAARI
jgi:signal transduction histidine kinase